MTVGQRIAQKRKELGLSQEGLAEKLSVSRQAVSRWERGETLPSSDLLKKLSEVFQVSINPLLGSPRQLICQSCGMPMQKEEDYGTETDGSRSEDYCVYCYKDGKFLADCTMEQMVDFCLKIGEDAGRYPDREQAKQQMLTYFPTLKRWKTEK